MKPKLKVLSIAPSISRKNGGVFEVQRNLAIGLSKLGVEQEIVGLTDDYAIEDLDKWGDENPKHYKHYGPRVIGFSPALLKLKKWEDCDIGHLHSIWDFISYALDRWARKKKKPFIVTANGMLNPSALAISTWKKNLALTIYERKILERASCIQVNTEEEYNAIRTFGLKNPVCIIGNGINLPDNRNVKSPPWKVDSGKKILLYLGRIHDSKGVDKLLNAWKEIQESEEVGWHLVMVGFGFYKNDYEANLKAKVQTWSSNLDVTLLNGQFHDDMIACYYHCDAFILPSRQEGLPMAVLTAWAYSKPVIITENCNLSDGFEKNAGIKIEHSKESIIVGIRELIECDDRRLKTMGENGYQLVKSKYTWDRVSGQILDIYNWVLGRTEVPNTVVQDEYLSQNLNKLN